MKELLNYDQVKNDDGIEFVNGRYRMIVFQKRNRLQPKFIMYLRPFGKRIILKTDFYLTPENISEIYISKKTIYEKYEIEHVKNELFRYIWANGNIDRCYFQPHRKKT